MTVGMSLVHWQKVRLSAGPVLVKLPCLCYSHGLDIGFSAMGSSAGRYLLHCALVPSLRILWLESPRVTAFVGSEEKPSKSRNNRSFILRIGVVSLVGVDAFWGAISPLFARVDPLFRRMPSFSAEFCSPRELQSRPIWAILKITSIFCGQGLAFVLYYTMEKSI